MSAKDLLESGTKWTDRIARLAFPILLRSAMDGGVKTYGQLNREVLPKGRASGWDLPFRFVAGKVGDVCEELRRDMEEDIPPLNSIIVGTSGLPSYGVEGYLEYFFGLKKGTIDRSNQENKDAYKQKGIELVHDFSGWPRVAAHLGIKIPKAARAADKKTSDLPDPREFATGPESKRHKELKLWVADNPEFLSAYGRFKKGLTEQELSSGDRLDVLFRNLDTRLAVEVKTREASQGEVMRGIFQCVKYRATLRAMQMVERATPNAQAVLVLEAAPSVSVAARAKMLSVDFIITEAD